MESTSDFTADIFPLERDKGCIIKATQRTIVAGVSESRI